MSSTYNHVRHKKGVIEQGMEKFIREEVEHQERLEAAGYWSPTWRVLRALQSLISAEQLQRESAVTAPPFYLSAGTERDSSVLRGGRRDRWSSYGMVWMKRVDICART